MKKLVLGAAVALVGLSALATDASAAVVCNREGECWHVRGHYNYRPEFGITVHPNNWRWNTGEKWRWREHEGRGYWRNGIWIRF